MAGPTPTKNTDQTRNDGTTMFFAGPWTNTDNYTDEIIVDLSGLAESMTNRLQIKRIVIAGSPGIAATVEIDDTGGDIPIAMLPLGATRVEIDYGAGRLSGNAAGHPQGGPMGDGDLVVTTRSAAADDELFIYVDWYAV